MRRPRPARRRTEVTQRPRPPTRQWSLANPLIRGGLLVLLFASLVLLLLPSRWSGSRQVREGEIARNAINASRTFSVELPDPKAEERIAAAKERVPRVFVYRARHVREQLAALDESFEAIRRACSERQSALAQFETDHKTLVEALRKRRQESNTPEALSDIEAQLTAANQAYPGELEAERERLTAAFERVRSEAAGRLGVDLEDDAFKPLEDLCYPEAIQEAAAQLLGRALEQYIVPYRGFLVSDIDRGIDVVRSGAALPVHLADTRQVLDQSQASERITGAVRELFAARGKAPFDRRPVQRAVVRLLRESVIPTLSLDEGLYRQALAAAENSVPRTLPRTYQQGQNIVPANQPITAEHVAALEAMEAGQALPLRWQTLLGVALLVVAMLAVVHRFASRHLPAVSLKGRDIVMVGTALVVQLALLKVSLLIIEALHDKFAALTRPALLSALPFAFGAMFVRLLVNAPTAVAYTLVSAPLVGLLLLALGQPSDSSITYLFLLTAYLLTNLVGIAGMSRIRHRAAVLQAGLWVAGVAVASAALFLLLRTEPLTWHSPIEAAVAGVGGFGSAFLVAALAPVVEWLFGYTTHVKLLELGSLDHPLLKEMVLSAPGTYHHSVVVGNLAEAAAEAISADPVLSRVAALYHDVGKTKGPEFFAENQAGGANPHNRLKPSMSALVLRAHVKDGVRIAREAGLGREILDIIEQHQGTTLMRYFYQKALDACGPDDPLPQEEDFRYAGPKPQTREAALVMLADACEAAIRSLPEKTAIRIRGMVRKVILEKFSDGQLDQCSITLKDLTVIEEKFNAILVALNHQRPQYPDGERRPATATKPPGKREPDDKRLRETVVDGPRRTRKATQQGLPLLPAPGETTAADEDGGWATRSSDPLPRITVLASDPGRRRDD